jgi:hypothetical protein
MRYLLPVVFCTAVGGMAHSPPPATQPCAYFPEALVRETFAPLAQQKLVQDEKGACRWNVAGPAVKRQGVSLNFQVRGVTAKTIDTLFNRMKNGVNQTVNGKQVVIAPKEVEWVPGVGDKAFWNHDLQQLAVSAKGVLFYVTVTLDGMTVEQKIQAAGKAAGRIIAQL